MATVKMHCIVKAIFAIQTSAAMFAHSEFGTLGRVGNDLLWWWIVSNSFISDGNNMKMDAEQVTATMDRADAKGVRVSII